MLYSNSHSNGNFSMNCYCQNHTNWTHDSIQCLYNYFAVFHWLWLSAFLLACWVFQSHMIFVFYTDMLLPFSVLSPNVEKFLLTKDINEKKRNYIYRLKKEKLFFNVTCLIHQLFIMIIWIGPLPLLIVVLTHTCFPFLLENNYGKPSF